jgi:predicted RNA-binding Zn-ribbon protein involved in translation (DUF1610 family)
MTPEELLEINPKLVSVTKFMKEHPDYPVRFWDNGTVDISLSERSKLGEFVTKFKCPSCGKDTDGPTIPTDAVDIKGTFRECPECSIKFFIHNKVKFGGTPA